MANILKCIKCQKVKNIRHFDKDKTRATGLHPYCRACRNEYARIRVKHRRQTDPEYKDVCQQSCKKYYYENRAKIVKNKRTMSDNYTMNARLKSSYNISIEEYNILLTNKNNVCAICKKKEKRKNRSGKIYKLHVDHCHKTGKIRGLLCHNCNTGIGRFKDDLILLNQALEYLKRSL